MALAIISQPQLLSLICGQLTHRDACMLLFSCKALAAAAAAVLPTAGCAARLLIASSGSSKVLELALCPDGLPYQMSSSSRTTSSSSNGGAAIRELPVTPAKRRRRGSSLTLRKRSSSWLTGVAVGPHDHCLYVCDYAAKGIRRLSGGSLRPLGLFASDRRLAAPEGIAFALNCCYVASLDNGSLVRLSVADGSVQQVLQLPEGLVPWGMTAWPEPATDSPVAAATSRQAAAALAAADDDNVAGEQSCFVAAGLAVQHDTAAAPAAEGAAAAAAAALFVAVDEEYEARYTVAPAALTGSVLMVPLSATGQLLPAQTFSTVAIRRPSGLCFDHADHMWVTSMDGCLLRLAGPRHSCPGALLQTVILAELLLRHQLQPPLPPGSLPFDVSSIISKKPCTCCSLGASGHSCGLTTKLAVTLHKGKAAAAAAAVAVLRLTQPRQRSAEPQQPSCEQLRMPIGVSQPGDGAVAVGVASVIRHAALCEPNMIAIQQ